MKSKLISIGDEILIGQIVNTNATYLGDKLFSAGIPAEKTIVIGDEETILLEELEDSVKNYDVTIITGGLGPTHDDITKPVLVKFFRDEMKQDEKVLAHVKNIFASRNIKMPEVNFDQAMVPCKSEVIWNQNGTAPGIWYESEGKVIISLPGVPYEMKAMMENAVIPKLTEKFSIKERGYHLQKTLLTTGLGESTLNEKLGDIKEITAISRLAFLPSAEGVRLRINVTAGTLKEAESILAESENKIRQKAGEFVYGINDETIELNIGKILRERKKTLSVAESCTGGEISSRLVSVSGSSDYYFGGICSYSNRAKVEILGVRKQTLKKFGAVSKETAIEMADGVRNIMGTDYAVSTTGIAGPSGGTEQKPVGLVWIGFSGGGKSFAMKFKFGGSRDINIKRASMRALEILRRELLDIEQNFY